jgi:hypothetical protein
MSVAKIDELENPHFMHIILLCAKFHPNPKRDVGGVALTSVTSGQTDGETERGKTICLPMYTET